MSIADQTELRVLAELLRAGLLPAEDAPAYPTETLKRAVAGVAKRLTYRPLRRA